MTVVAPMGHPQREEIRSLTGLRFLAAAYVLVFHSGAGFLAQVGIPSWGIRFVANGYLGVTVFFVLSGFILGYTYRNGVGSLSGYAVARFARIYPVYLFALLLALPLVLHKLEATRMTSVLLMTQSWGGYAGNTGFDWVMQAWTLSVEAVFYVVFPLIMYVVCRVRLAASLALLALVALPIVLLGTPGISPGEAPVGIPEWVQGVPLPLLRLPEFAFGVLLSRVFLLGVVGGPSASSFRGDFAPCMIAACACVLLCFADRTTPYFLGLFAICVGVLIISLACSRGLFSNFLGTRTLLLLGGASYAIYLLQGPVREWMRVLSSDSLLVRMAYPFVLLTLAIAVFLYLETPARKLLVSGFRRRP